MDEPQTPYEPFAPELFDSSGFPAESEQIPELRPNGALWMFYLFLRPKVFFRHFVIDAAPLLTALAAWMLGVELLDDAGYRLSARQSVQQWGPHEGHGFRFRMTGEDTDVQTFYFASTSKDAGFEIFEFCAPDTCEEQEPGFAIIRDSFELKQKPVEAQP